MSCKLDSHEYVADINEMLREDPPRTYGAIRDFLLSMNSEVPDRYLISRHKSHLGIPKKIKAVEPTADATGDVLEVAELSLRIFHQRLLENPADVATRDLIPFIQVLLKRSEGESEQTGLMESLRQIQDANEN